MMKPFLSILLTLVLAGGLAASPAADADVDPYRLFLAERGDIPWQSLSREEQEALQRHHGNWDQYSSDRQQRMRQGAQRYLELPPEKQREVDRRRREYQNLPPQERKRLREEYRRRRD